MALKCQIVYKIYENEILLEQLETFTKIRPLENNQI